MNPDYSLLIAAAPACLLAVGLVPSRWANRHVFALRRAAMWASWSAFGVALVSAAALAAYGPLAVSFVRVNGPLPVSLGVYFDSLAAVMLVLVGFIGVIITRFSLRYLDGENRQGRFLRWICFSLGAVQMLIVSGNLMMFTGAWMLTSFGLHQLLTHYSDRPAAMLAARKKFLISRLGDVLLVAALVLTYLVFGSFAYEEVFAAAQTLGEHTLTGHWLLPLIGALYVLGAMTKSAQVPFHSWLPDTMETPTPVSALMHAGIINAGGFLVIRLSPLISLSHLALDFLAVVGALTALFGSVVMLTQTSVKRSLAYSTIAQMGFMMLQCGLGAFSAALLHIVAHSLYKAHAFLSSGSVLEAAAGMKGETPAQLRPMRGLVTWAAATLAATGICTAVAWSFGVMTKPKPGALLLGLILVIALTHLLWKAFAVRRWPVAIGGLLIAVAVSCGYYAAYAVMDKVLATSVSNSVVPPSAFDKIWMLLVALGFLSVLMLQASLASWNRSSWFKSLYVHASNGFYFDIAAQKMTVKIWRRLSTAR